MDKSTSQYACNLLAELMVANGIEDVVISPGSRNAPLIMALARKEGISTKVVVDERSAAFIALGMAQQINKPVALLCTSGTAMLNYAPAIAEAYYQKIPLLVITADRPSEWIDQDDSQTITQVGAYGKLVKKSYDIPSSYTTENLKWYVSRILNEAVLSVCDNKHLPVHVNFQLDVPLYDEVEKDKIPEPRIISNILPTFKLDDSDIENLSEVYSTAKKVMIVCGFHQKDDTLQTLLNKLAGKKNTVVLTETISNINGERIIKTIDRVLSHIDEKSLKEYCPDLLISFGGSLVSRMLKETLRKYRAQEHWYVGVKDYLVDTMKSVTKTINSNPTVFLSQLLPKVKECESSYAEKWYRTAKDARKSHDEYVAHTPWSDMRAYSILTKSLKPEYQLQLSNGTSIRYAQLFGDDVKCRCYCNRGVSGIDGSTSTALGASLKFNNTTVFITGDMSFSYDINGMMSQYRNEKFKVVVMRNGGGGIFRFLNGPSDLPELEKYFAVPTVIDIVKLIKAMDYECYSVNDEKELSSCLPDFLESGKPSVLVVNTSGDVSAKVLRGYFKRNINNNIIR